MGMRMGMGMGRGTRTAGKAWKIKELDGLDP